VIGDVKHTVPDFLRHDLHAPVGAAIFDLDYYSSTKEALTIFQNPDHMRTLPRVLCYFDDIASIEDVGAMLAIREFNEENATRKIKPNLSRPTLVLDYDARRKIFEYHDFEHPQYGTLIRKENKL
jgi:hypothetical protein